MTQRVVVTGLGIVSSLGNNASEVTDSLRNGKSGITYNATQEEIGMRSWVSGKPDIDLSEHIDRKQWRFMGDAAGYAFLSMEQAIADSGLTPEQVSNVRTGIIAGSGGASSASIFLMLFFSKIETKSFSIISIFSKNLSKSLFSFN